MTGSGRQRHPFEAFISHCRLGVRLHHHHHHQPRLPHNGLANLHLNTLLGHHASFSRLSLAYDRAAAEDHHRCDSRRTLVQPEDTSYLPTNENVMTGAERPRSWDQQTFLYPQSPMQEALHCMRLCRHTCSQLDREGTAVILLSSYEEIAKPDAGSFALHEVLPADQSLAGWRE